MGTHPIFESDFDCLTEGTGIVLGRKMCENVDARSIVSKVVDGCVSGLDTEVAMTMTDHMEMQEHADAVLGASDPDACSYSKGYVVRQALYSCMTCVTPDNVGGICLACSLTCHKDCELIELYTKRNFRCDCGNSKFKTGCELQKAKDAVNEKNTYSQNYRGLYCTCARPYPDAECPPELEGDEMIQCIVCEDWYHGRHLNVDEETLDAEDNGELVCIGCTEEKTFLRFFSVDNKCTDPVSDVCKRPKEAAEVSKSGMFLRATFRSELCDCTDCTKTLAEQSIEFLSKPGDSMEEYESEGKHLLDAESEATDNTINTLLDQLDHRGQQEIAYGINAMKSAMTSMLASVGEGDQVTAEHVEVFKRKLQEDIEARKRRRLGQ